MNSEELKSRTKQFAITVIKFAGALPSGLPFAIIGKQLLRAATSVGANYRSACRARSRTDFVSKITIVEEEADECLYWIELLQELGNIDSRAAGALYTEAFELTAIFTASGKTAKQRRQ
jgi:four helix bundle protein